MKKCLMVLGAVALNTLSLDASAYTHTANVNGSGASLNQGATIGLGPGGTGPQYHHWVDALAPGETWSVTGDQYAMYDPMRPANGDASAYGVTGRSWCQGGGCDPADFGPGFGSDHWTQHILFTLTDDSRVTIQLSNAAAVAGKHSFQTNTGNLAGNLIPAFTLFSGKGTTGFKPQNHIFENMGGAHWSNITYMTHDANTANASSISLDDYLLAAGDYTLYIGGNTSDTSAGKNFALSISASPVPVPAAVWLFGSALAGLGAIGRRKDKAAD